MSVCVCVLQIVNHGGLPGLKGEKGDRVSVKDMHINIFKPTYLWMSRCVYVARLISAECVMSSHASRHA